MKFDDFFRGDLEGDPAGSLQDLLRGILIRTQFVPVVRHVIGWRGLKQSPSDPGSWTAKVAARAGVFGIFPMGTEPRPGWAAGRFGLCYFPDPAEPLVERCSLRAAAFTQAEEYWACVRAFPRDREMCGLFGIGSILLSLRADRKALGISLESVTSLRTISADGVRVAQEGREVLLLEPGGTDQDFPAFETACGFFDVLAASLSFNLERPPDRLVERRFPAKRAIYDRSGSVSEAADPELRNVFVLLGFGEGDFASLCPDPPENGDSPLSETAAGGPENAPPEYRDRLWWRAHGLKDSKGIDKKLLGVDERPPLVLLTGFLGSGKTSFLQHFIEYQTQRSRYVAVIQNEVGEIGLDGKLLDYTVTEIDEGCVCCSLAGNLKRAIRGILENFSPDVILLETTGLANPLNMREDLEELEEMVRLDATVTVVDALNLEAALSESPFAADQIRAADVLLLNKKDLVDEAGLEAARRRVREINRKALLFETRGGNLNPALLFDLGEPSGADAGAGISAAEPGGCEDASSRAAHAEAGIWSRTLKLPAPLDRDAFLREVASLPPSVFRVKGLVDFSDSETTTVFQYVCGRFELSPFSGRGIEERFLTFIGRDDDSGTRELLETLCRGTASPP